MQLKIEKISPLAKMPSRAYQHDAGLDLYSIEDYSLKTMEIRGISTGIKMAIPADCVGLVWDKGGVSKMGVHTMGGVIDAGYRGEIIINIINLGPETYEIKAGQKIAQILIQKVELPEIIEGAIKDETERGGGAFGSSGKF